MMEGCREGAHQASWNKEVLLTSHDSWTARIWDAVGFLETTIQDSKIPTFDSLTILQLLIKAQTARRGVLPIY